MKHFLLSLIFSVLIIVPATAQETRINGDATGTGISKNCSIAYVSIIILGTLETTYKKGEVVQVFAAIGNYRRDFEIVWKLSRGKIIEGQSTLLIKIDSKKVKGNSITATIVLRQKNTYLGNKCRTSESITVNFKE